MLGSALTLEGHDLTQHAEQLHPQLVRGDEAVRRVGGARLQQQPVQRVVLLEQRRLVDRGEGGDVSVRPIV